MVVTWRVCLLETAKSRRASHVRRSASARMAGMIGSRMPAGTSLVLFAVGCGGRGMLPPPASPAASAALSEATVPKWRAGDRWVYDCASGQERGTRTVEMRDSTAVNGVDYCVVVIGPAAQQYYTKDLHVPRITSSPATR